MNDEPDDYEQVLSAKESAEHGSATPSGEGLSFIAPRETARVIKARRQRSTGWLRVALPAAAGFLLLLLILWPMIESHKIAVAVMKNIPDLVIDNLHFSGLDDKNQPYALTAAKATRPSGTGNVYDLDQPQGDITLTNGTWVAGKAQYGRFDSATHRLWLGGDVQLFQDKGYQFTTDEAQVELSDRYAYGEKPVLIQGDFGEIRGQGFRFLDGGSVMVVKGPAKAILSLHPHTPSDTPTPMPKDGAPQGAPKPDAPVNMAPQTTGH